MPYGRALFDRWLALTGNPVETLCFLGKRCMGALEFEPAIEAGYDPDQCFEIDSLVDVAREALASKAAFGANHCLVIICGSPMGTDAAGGI